VDIAVGIINWNSGHWLKLCIQSIVSTAEPAEITIVDNASTDRSLEGLQEITPSIQLIRNSKNRGFAGGVNQVFAATRSPFVMILNPDVESTPGSIQRLYQLLTQEPQAAAAGGHTGPGYPPRKLPTVGSLIRENLGIWRRPPDGSSTDPYEVQQPAAAAFMIRRSAFEKIGGFDESFYPAWYEDVDFCSRLKSAGWQIYFAPQAEFLHEGGYSASALGVEAFAESYYHNQLRYALKHFGRVGALSVRLSITAGMLGRMLVQPQRSRAHFKTILGALIQW